MWWHGLLAFVLTVSAVSQTLATDFPYTAYINSADVYVRSGPGRNYYPTDKLQRGEKVEIYRHDPGGWYAIRPPRGSFSWVSSRHLDPIDDQLATVNTDRVVARVGSSFSDVRDVIQVRLDKKEQVELFEPHGEDSPWYKISPPSGEFRWVFAKYVDADGPLETADADPTDAGSVEPAAHREERSSQVRLAAGSEDGASNAAPKAPPVAAPRESTEVATSLQAEMNRIDLELSTIVAEEISVWSFDDLKRRADAALAQAQTPAERGQARILVNKLSRFADIKQRHDAIRRDGVDPRAVAGPVTPRRTFDPRYDGVGRLSPVVSPKSGGPQYALVDASNAVISFVTPAPGVNLRQYVDKYVGVNGQRGYLTDLRREHISVQRVTTLDVTRR